MSGFLNPIGAIVETVGSVIDDLHTSDQERAQMELENKREDNKLLLAQTEINKVEAASGSLFIGGWRPAIGWTCAMALWMVYVPRALVMTVLWAYQAWQVVGPWNGVGPMPELPRFPELGVADLIGLVLAMLGMAGLRTREKEKGVAG